MSASVLLKNSEFQRIQILENYGRTPESVKQDIENVKNWLNKQPHLPDTPNDKIIERFLALSKFHVEDAKQKIDMYYSVRSLIPEFFDVEPNGPRIQKIMDIIYLVPFPELTQKLQRVFVLQLKDYETDNFDFIALISYSFLIAEIRLREECCLSDVYIYDMAGAKIGHLTKFTPTILRKFVFMFEKVFSNRVDGLHFINAPTFIESVLSLITTYFKQKLANRVFVHKNLESLYEIIEKDILPTDFGGKQMSLSELQDKWKQKFNECVPLFQYIRSLKVKEELRIGKLQAADLLGIDGNFRQLTVD